MPAASPDQPHPDPHLEKEAEAQDSKPAYHHRRTGRIAQLPKELRDRINQMILDGFPYAKILETLGEPVKHINEDNLGDWKKGGYEDWLRDLDRKDDLRLTRDAALSLVSEKAGGTVQDAGLAVAAAQLYELLLKFNPRAIAESLADKPELYFRIINSLSRLSEGEAVCSRRRAQGSLIAAQLGSPDQGEAPPVISPEKLKQLIHLLKLL